MSRLSQRFFGKKTILIPTLVNTDKFQLSKKKREEIRRKYGIAETDIVMGLIGSFDNDYNRPSLTYLYGNIDKFSKATKFLVIGKLDSGYKMNHPKIIYTGYVDDYVGHLSALDYVMVYRTLPTDGAINRIVEAMSMGISVCANPIASQTVGYKLGIDGRKVAEEYYSEKKYKKELVELLK